LHHERHSMKNWTTGLAVIAIALVALGGGLLDRGAFVPPGSVPLIGAASGLILAGVAILAWLGWTSRTDARRRFADTFLSALWGVVIPLGFAATMVAIGLLRPDAMPFRNAVVVGLTGGGALVFLLHTHERLTRGESLSLESHWGGLGGGLGGLRLSGALAEIVLALVLGVVAVGTAFDGWSHKEPAPTSAAPPATGRRP
jgi:hypothetical protein